MFKPGAQFNHNDNNYHVVHDHIVVLNGERGIDDKHFISSSQKISSSLEIGFLNDYQVVEYTNPVGFWQTILNNYAFDYSSNFKYKLSLGDNTELYLISFDISKGITLHADANLVQLDDFKRIEVDLDSFNKFDIIRTKQQIKQDKVNFWRSLIIKHIVLYSVISVSIFSYYQYKNSVFSEERNYSDSLETRMHLLNDRIEGIKGNVIVLETHHQQSHIINLLNILDGGIVIQESSLDLTKSFATITIDFADLEMIKYIAKSNNVAIRIARNFSKNTAKVTWENRGKQ
ncbi:hypothetical protein MNB_SUP05-SYMBIONT-5-1184 [hydrothermal vent metagenome]|uniref:Uncharacterized protein n=1 Tax=hydrothermal vent metagenome TaxID=652676 RepID=A0A1W1E0N8_9ZZZZ